MRLSNLNNLKDIKEKDPIMQLRTTLKDVSLLGNLAVLTFPKSTKAVITCCSTQATETERTFLSTQDDRRLTWWLLKH
jgi:hypothetical protein